MSGQQHSMLPQGRGKKAWIYKHWWKKSSLSNRAGMFRRHTMRLVTSRSSLVSQISRRWAYKRSWLWISPRCFLDPVQQGTFQKMYWCHLTTTRGSDINSWSLQTLSKGLTRIVYRPLSGDRSSNGIIILVDKPFRLLPTCLIYQLLIGGKNCFL